MPKEYSTFTSVKVFGVGLSQLNGTIPSAYSTFRNITEFGLRDNKFTGTLPSQLSTFTRVQNFRVFNNSLTGTIPESYSAMKRLSSFCIQHNSFRGTMPAFFKNMSYLKYFVVNDNFFTGTLPSITNATKLATFFVQYNNFTGTLDHVLSPSNHPRLQSVDFSNNAFTGSLPASIFSSRSIESISVSSTCLQTKIPDNVCDLSKLKVLVLNGLDSAPSCRINILPWLGFKAYYFHSKPTTIPSCIYSLGYLRTLQLAGNLYSGSLEGVSLGANLTELILSHNNLRGSIPDSFQLKKYWSKLDLSYNKLDGTLRSDFNIQESSYLSLQVNRISGSVPQSTLALPRGSIYILDGNLFNCNSDRSDIPKNDEPAYEKFSCGSEELWRALLFALVGYVVVLIPGVMVYFSYRNFNHRDDVGRRIHSYVIKPTVMWSSRIIQQLASFMLIYTEIDANSMTVEHRATVAEDKNFISFGHVLGNIRLVFGLVTAIVMVALLPLLGILSATLPNVYFYSYGWKISPAFLAGIQSASAMFVIFLLFCLSIYVVLKRFIRNVYATTESEGSDPSQSSADNYRLNLLNAFMAIANFSFMLTINSFYVIATSNYRTLVLAIITYMMCLFKIAWSKVVIPFSLSLTSSLVMGKRQLSLVQRRHNLVIYTILNVSNNILCPCIATALISPNCFHNAIVQAPAVKSSYTYLFCQVPNYFISALCDSLIVQEVYNEFSPPFEYAGTCSLTITRTYVPLFVYMFFSIAFIEPSVVLIHKGLRLLLSSKFPKLFKFLSTKMNSLWNSTDLQEDDTENSDSSANANDKHEVVVNDTTDDTRLSASISYRPTEILTRLSMNISFIPTRKCFDSDIFVAEMLNYFVILITFGAVYPPLAVLICLAIYSRTWFVQLGVGRLALRLKTLDFKRKLSRLERECAGMGSLFMYGTRNILIYSHVFFSIFVMDLFMESGRVGPVETYLLGGLMVLIPLLVRLCVNGRQRYLKQKRRNALSEAVDRDSEILSESTLDSRKHKSIRTLELRN